MSRLNTIIDATEREIRDNINEQQNFTQELNNSHNAAESLKDVLENVAKIAAGMSGGAEVSYAQMVDYATQLGKALDGTYGGLKKR